MDRLTGRNEKGDLLVNEKVVYAGNFYEVASKLEEYEDLEESLEKTYGKCDGLLETAVKYLADHKGVRAENPEKSLILTDEDAEKWLRWKESEAAGKLINLPCKPGDTVYTNFAVTGWYMRKEKMPYKAKVVFVGISEDPFFNVVYEEGKMWQFKFSDIGKTVFLTEQEAKEALESMR